MLDNLNTHKPASLYEAFPPEEARAIARKLEFHYTPKPVSVSYTHLDVYKRQEQDSYQLTEFGILLTLEGDSIPQRLPPTLKKQPNQLKRKRSAMSSLSTGQSR